MIQDDSFNDDIIIEGLSSDVEGGLPEEFTGDADFVFALSGSGSNTYNESGNGGAVTDGSATVAARYNPSLSGGGVVGGQESDTMIYNTILSGGVVVGGSAGGVHSYNEAGNGGVVVGGQESDLMIYKPSSSGGAVVGGTALLIVSIMASGGVVVGGDPVQVTVVVFALGGVVVGGIGIQTFIDYVDAKGGVIVGGRAIKADLHVFFYKSSGGVTVDGTPDLRVGRRYIASGQVNVGGSARAKATFDLNIGMSWNIRSAIFTDIGMLWNSGDLPIYWYRIIGAGHDGTQCNLIADPCCQKYIVNIHAKTPTELCQKLSALNLNMPIQSVQKFTRPAETAVIAAAAAKGITFDCNQLVQVEICHIPSCSELCIDYDVRVPFQFDITNVQVNGDFSYVANGSVFVGGFADTSNFRNVPHFHYAACGGLTISGEAESESNPIGARGGVNVGGSVHIQSNRWTFVSDGQAIVVSGTADVLSTAMSYEGGGDLNVGQHGASYSIKRYFAEKGTGGVVLGSSAIVLADHDPLPIGGVVVGGSALVRPYVEFGSGGIAVGGSAVVKPYREFASGGVRIGGSATNHVRFKQAATGGVRVGGNGNTTFHHYQASGGLTFGGSASVKSSAWKHVATGSVSISGSSNVRGSYLGTFVEVADFETTISDVIVTFPSDTNVPTAAILSHNTAQCGCLQIPLNVNFTQNLSINNKLSQFLARNSFVLPAIQKLAFNQSNGSWQSNLHYRGQSGSMGTERWDIVYELQCTNTVGGTEIGRTIWRLSVDIFQRTTETRNTHIVIGVLPAAICETTTNELIFDVSLNTQTGVTTVDPTSTIYQAILFDNIGMFKNKYWVDNPELVLKVSQAALDSPQTRLNLTSQVLVN